MNMRDGRSIGAKERTRRLGVAGRATYIVARQNAVDKLESTDDGKEGEEDVNELGALGGGLLVAADDAEDGVLEDLGDRLWVLADAA